MSDESNAENPAGGSKKISTTAAVNVLIVDDDVLTSWIHERLMCKMGVEAGNVRKVVNGREAVDLCLAGEAIDIIFMDKEMPVMDGVEATRELRRNGVRSLIIGLTSTSSEEEIEEFKSAGLDECFAKPLTTDIVQQLLQKINKEK